MNNKLDQIKQAAEIVKKGGVIAFPTETVMGLGVIYDNEQSYNRLNVVKKRPPEKPYTLMLSDENQIENYAYLNDTAKKVISKFCPGPITLLLRVKNVPSWVTNGSSTIGVRVPSYETTLSLLKEVGKPLLVPSANKSGEKPSISYQEVKDVFNQEIDFVIEEDSGNDKPSTIIDLTSDNVKVIREGSLSFDEILRAIKGE